MIGAALFITAAAGTVISSNQVNAELPEYVGAEACLGCHTNYYDYWDDSGHAHMMMQVIRNADLPGDPAMAAPELAAELAKADWIIAGQRFLARDPATGDLAYLNVQWNGTEYVAYKGGSNWNANCAGCHTSGYNKETKTFATAGIGCESCHGPGKEHILGKGDPSKIIASTDSQVCGQCHMGGGGMPDGTRWPVGFKPGMNIEDTGFAWKTTVDPTQIPPSSSLHLRQYPEWKVSAHAKAVVDLEGSGHAQDRCFACHSSTALDMANSGQTFNAEQHKVYDGVSCVACHRAHSLHLIKDEQTTCTQCHNGSIKPGTTATPGSAVHHPMAEMLTGYGAIGVADTKGAHSDLKCIDCHMTGGNHLFHVIRPEDGAAANRQDTCTACHTGRSAESRTLYLDLWQESVGSRLATIKADIDVVDAALKANPAALSTELADKYKAARTNWTYVDSDGSKGVHNFDYALKILSDAGKVIAEAKAAVK